MDIKQLFNKIDERKEELFEILCNLIKINSESFGDYGNEEESARYIDKLYKELGLESDLYSPMDIEGFENHPDYMPGRNLENCLFAVPACPTILLFQNTAPAEHLHMVQVVTFQKKVDHTSLMSILNAISLLNLQNTSQPM